MMSIYIYIYKYLAETYLASLHFDMQAQSLNRFNLDFSLV